MACHTCAIHSLVSGYCRRTWKGQLPVIVPHVPRKGFYLATRFFSSCCFCSFSFSSCIILFVAAPSSFPFLRLCAFELSVSSQTLLKACRTQTTRTLKKKLWQTWVWVCFKCLFVHLGTTCNLFFPTVQPGKHFVPAVVARDFGTMIWNYSLVPFCFVIFSFIGNNARKCAHLERQFLFVHAT